ncbi:lactoylglutathione lyase [Duganella sp. FT135W]|uniref:Aldoketomutase n=2 Tax=Duganella flavida TaxID=2692175 RepID=A0A6L8KCR3_9BURK|nr:lactoylglutathione lyase [Duganella flavida]
MKAIPQACLSGAHLVYSMLRVSDLEQSLDFYCGKLGMTLLRREEYPTGAFTLAFVGYGPSPASTIELTHNWDGRKYQHGTGFGHLAIGVDDLKASCDALAAVGVRILRAPGPMLHLAEESERHEHIAFIADPDGYRVELVQNR